MAFYYPTIPGKWCWIKTEKPLAFVSKEKSPEKKSNAVLQEKKKKEEQYLLCKLCNNRITKITNRFEVQGGAEHSFLNPAGMVFHIGCFRDAEGCLPVGDVQSEWSWFKGFRWQVVCCDQCLNHLGWLFLAKDKRYFYGLILSSLV